MESFRNGGVVQREIGKAKDGESKGVHGKEQHRDDGQRQRLAKLRLEEKQKRRKSI